MACGRIGAQHRARVIGRSPTPSISTSEPRFFFAAAPLRGTARANDRLRRWLGQPFCRLHELRHRDLAFAQQLMHVVDVVRLQLRHQRGHLLRPHAQPSELSLGDLATSAPVIGDIELAEPRPHLRPVARRDEVTLFRREPVATGCGVLARDDLDDLAVRHLVVERHDAPVDLRPPAAMAEVRVDVVGEIQRRRAARQIHDFALRGERVDTVLEQLRAHAFEEVLVRVGRGLLASS